MLNSTPRTFVGSTTVSVRGMTCGHCEHAVSQKVGQVEGVRDVRVDLATGTVTADRPVDRADIAAAVDEAGYTLVPCPPEYAGEAEMTTAPATPPRASPPTPP